MIEWFGLWTGAAPRGFLDPLNTSGYGQVVIIWLNGTHGAGKTTTSALLQPLVPHSRIFDAEKVGETLMDVKPGLPETDNFQHWPLWRPLVVETARRLLDYVGGVLIMPMTVLVQPYWREISAGLAQHAIPVRHFVLHADPAVLRQRIVNDQDLGPSTFRLRYVDDYEIAFSAWMKAETEVVDTADRSARDVARLIAAAVTADNLQLNARRATGP